VWRDASFWRSWRGGLVLVLISLAVYVPGQWTLPAIDRDESRFAQASRQMAESDRLADWVVPRVQERARLNKPPVIYWLQALSVRAFAERLYDSDASTRRLDDAIWMYRLPSALAALATVLMVWRWGWGAMRMHPAAAGLAAAGLAVSPVMVWEAHQARADMVLVAVTTAALWTLTAVLRARDKAPRWRTLWRVILLWVLVGLGVLVKGPITPMVVVLGVIALAAWNRSWVPVKRVKPVLGVVVVALVVTPWVVLVMREYGAAEYLALIKDETVGRSMEAKEGHWGPPGYHLVLSFVMLAPLALTLGLGVWRGVARARSASLLRARDARHASAILMAILVPSWIVFELVSTKLPHYTMPLLGVLALLGVRAALSGWARGFANGPRAKEWFKFCCSAYAIGIALLAMVLCGVATMALWVGEMRALAVVAGLAGLALAAWGVVMIERHWRRGDLAAALRTGVLVVGGSSVVFMLGGPTLPWVHTSANVAKQIRAIDPAGTRPILAVEYQEDSLIFETHGRARRVSAEEALDALRSDAKVLVVMPWEMAAANRVKVSGSRVKGFNYSRGEWVDLVIAERNAADVRSR
jgi:4-amino-4-deoxy-L-arabinose transferase-like glycosyltransferase